MEPFADTTDVETAWRAMSQAEKAYAERLLRRVSSDIRRRWPDVDARTADPTDPLTVDDVKDIVLELVVTRMRTQARPDPAAKSWQVTSGSESRQITLESGDTGTGFDYEQWMIDVLDGSPAGPAAPAPLAHMPLSQPFDKLFYTDEVYR